MLVPQILSTMCSFTMQSFSHLFLLYYFHDIIHSLLSKHHSFTHSFIKYGVSRKQPHPSC